MGFILKNTSGLINSKLTDTARQMLSQGKFNITYFQVGDSEMLNTLIMLMVITETHMGFHIWIRLLVLFIILRL